MNRKGNRLMARTILQTLGAKDGDLHHDRKTLGTSRQYVRHENSNQGMGDHNVKQSAAMQLNRRNFLKMTGAAGASLPFWQMANRAEAASKKRNLIFILIDDMRFDSMSCMGHPFLQTPNLDRMVAWRRSV